MIIIYKLYIIFQQNIIKHVIPVVTANKPITYKGLWKIQAIAIATDDVTHETIIAATKTINDPKNAKKDPRKGMIFKTAYKGLNIIQKPYFNNYLPKTYIIYPPNLPIAILVSSYVTLL